MISRLFFLGRALMVLAAATAIVLQAAAIARAATVDEMPAQMRQAYIVGIQEQLRDHGYRPGLADGRLGPATVNAIRRYQRDAGLPVDGVASKALLDHLMFALPKVNAKTAASGYDPVVADIQRELAQLGYYRGRVDGLAGPLTRGAVRAFAQATGVSSEVKLDRALLDRIRSSDLSLRQ